MGAVEEWEGGEVASGEVAICRENFSEKIGGVNRAMEEYKTEGTFGRPLIDLVETHVDRFRLLSSNEEVAMPIAHSLTMNRRG